MALPFFPSLAVAIVVSGVVAGAGAQAAVITLCGNPVYEMGVKPSGRC